MKNEPRPKDVIDVLLDEKDKDPIILTDVSGRRLTFEQIAVIPHDEKLYCILKPIDHIDGLNEDEPIVFYVYEEEGKEPSLMVETDELKATSVFKEYYNLLDEERKKRKR